MLCIDLKCIYSESSSERHWFPYVARHFPEHFPFPQSRPPTALPPYPAATPPPYVTTSPPVIHQSSDKMLVPILSPPPPAAPRPMRRVREVKFAEPKDVKALRRSEQPV